MLLSALSCCLRMNGYNGHRPSEGLFQKSQSSKRLPIKGTHCFLKMLNLLCLRRTTVDREIDNAQANSSARVIESTTRKPDPTTPAMVRVARGSEVGQPSR